MVKTRLSGITMALAGYIVISASFMLQVSRLLMDTFGDEAVKVGFFVLFFLIAGLFIAYIAYKRLPIYRIALSLIVFGLAYLLISRQPFFAEKFHVVEYGLLGYLALKDFSKEGKEITNIMYALCFLGLVGFLDEGFQRILPYRVFEVRDIVTNVISGALGVFQFLACRRAL